MSLRSLTNIELRDRAMLFVAKLRSFARDVDHARSETLDKTLPGWSDAARASGFLQTTQSLKHQHRQMQTDFDADFRTEADALQVELMARLGIPVRNNGEQLKPLNYDAADYLEELVARLVL